MDSYKKIKELNELRLKGFLADDEFQIEKHKILDNRNFSKNKENFSAIKASDINDATSKIHFDENSHIVNHQESYKFEDLKNTETTENSSVDKGNFQGSNQLNSLNEDQNNINSHKDFSFTPILIVLFLFIIFWGANKFTGSNSEERTNYVTTLSGENEISKTKEEV